MLKSLNKSKFYEAIIQTNNSYRTSALSNFGRIALATLHPYIEVNGRKAKQFDPRHLRNVFCDAINKK